MDVLLGRKKLFKTLAFLIFIILVLNFFALKFFWYDSIWWFDMPMHFLGGLWLGLVFIWFLLRKNIPLELSFKLILEIILFVLLVGVLWEFFEFFTNNYIGGDHFNILDTVSDIFFDLAGGTFAVLYFFKKTVSSYKNKV